MSKGFDRNVFLNFFDHPTTPCFVPKGEQRNVVFDVPPAYYPEEYKALIPEKAQAVSFAMPSHGVIPVPAYTFPDDLGVAKKLDKRANFTPFNPFHQECADIVIKRLLKVESEKLLSYCTKLSLELNPYLFDYALSVALLHRNDTNKIVLPSAATYFPEFYLDAQALKECNTQGSIVVQQEHRTEVKIEPAASDLDIENRIAYFREDIGLNLHHWHWHIIYPSTGDPKIVGKDRRGELFYYMHQQALGRYNIERLCNRLHRAASLSYWREPVAEGYFPKLETPFMRNKWATRSANSYIQDLNRPNVQANITSMELWRDRILDAIHTGNYLDMDGQFKPLNPDVDAREREGYYDDGIDILGNLVEATSNSKNFRYYGNLHIQGHLFLAFCHDPDFRYLEGNGVIGDNKTAMRDPAFYRWHSFIDDLFQEYKSGLPPYTTEQLLFKDVKIEKLQIQTTANKLIPGLEKKPKINELYTFKQLDKINVASGLDVKNTGSIYVKFPHLQHQDFDYTIEVSNAGAARSATVRIFLAPTTDETNTPYDPEKSSFPLKLRRRLFIELDKFVVKLGKNEKKIIKRSSQDSSVTVPFHQMFMDVEELKKLSEGANQNAYEAANTAFCGCGWPHHLLIPRGMARGYPCHLFVMLTDYALDKVPQTEEVDMEALYAGKTEECKCKAITAVSYCGLKNKKYPDKKPMGFPFDRIPASIPGKRDVSLHDFANPIPNMKIADVIIYHKNIQVDGEKVSTPVTETDLYTS